MKKVLVSLCISLLVFAYVGVAQADIININSLTRTSANPITMFLQAGTYNVLPIGVADGGAYNAWNAWSTVNLPSAGWINRYNISSDEFGELEAWDHVRYSTPIAALNNAFSTSFTLTSDANVNFYILDKPYAYYDNNGGMSLDVSAVPIPGAVWLLGSGLLGLVGFRRKFRKV